MKTLFKKFKKLFLIALALIFLSLALWQLGVFGNRAAAEAVDISHY